MKKGLRPLSVSSLIFSTSAVGRIDLMKKGLRQPEKPVS